MKDKIAQLMSQSAYNKPQHQESFTMDKLKEIIASMPKPELPPMQNPLSAFDMYNQFRVHKSEHLPKETVPKFQLNGSVIMSDKCRNDVNKWLLEFFGTKEVSTAYMFGNNLMISHKMMAVINTNLI